MTNDIIRMMEEDARRGEEKGITESLIERKVEYEVETRPHSGHRWVIWSNKLEKREYALNTAERAKRRHPNKQFRVVKRISVKQECLNI